MKMTTWMMLSVGIWIASFQTNASAAPTVTITTGTPTRNGNITLKFFKCADAACTHGVSAECTIPIPAGITPAQKAALIEDVLNNPVATPNPPGGCGLTVVRGGNVLTVTNPPNGVECTKATDSTGEAMIVGNNTTGLPVDYVSNFRLSGTPESGSVVIGENATIHNVPTAIGEPIANIYANLAAAFGEGSVGPNGFTLPPRNGSLRSFRFNVTDPGLTIEVTQDDPQQVPSLSEQGLLALSALLLVSGAVMFWRRPSSRRRPSSSR